jgi:uncharacterized membrane protein YcaP (DUF421 family)
MTKIMGQRSISQLRLLDFIMALSLGNIIAHPLSDPKIGLEGSMITTAIFVIFYGICIFLSLKWYKFRCFLAPLPFPLIKNGQIIYKSLTRARISIDYLLSELRKERIEDVQKVSLALWEPDGSISIFLNTKNQTVTTADMQLQTKPFDFPRIIIKEGRIDLNELNQICKDEIWLKNLIKIKFNADVNDILLATINNSDNLKIFLYK